MTEPWKSPKGFPYTKFLEFYQDDKIARWVADKVPDNWPDDQKRLAVIEILLNFFIDDYNERLNREIPW